MRTTVLAAVVGCGLTMLGVLLAVRNVEFAPALAALLAVLSLGLGAAALRAWWQQRAGAGAVLTALLIACAALPVVQLHGDDRRGAWSYQSARVIQATVPAGEAIYVHEVVWDVPHLLWYADRPIVSAGERLDRRQRLPDEPAWLIVTPGELERLERRQTLGLSEPIELRPGGDGGVGPVLLRYDPTR
ncbi:MAG: hypothetical protein AAF078_02180 [Planctomycetota bacterium]